MRGGFAYAAGGPFRIEQRARLESQHAHLGSAPFGVVPISLVLPGASVEAVLV